MTRATLGQQLLAVRRSALGIENGASTPEDIAERIIALTNCCEQMWQLVQPLLTSRVTPQPDDARQKLKAISDQAVVEFHITPEDNKAAAAALSLVFRLSEWLLQSGLATAREYEVRDGEHAAYCALAEVHNGPCRDEYGDVVIGADPAPTVPPSPSSPALTLQRDEHQWTDEARKSLTVSVAALRALAGLIARAEDVAAQFTGPMNQMSHDALNGAARELLHSFAAGFDPSAPLSHTGTPER